MNMKSVGTYRVSELSEMDDMPGCSGIFLRICFSIICK